MKKDFTKNYIVQSKRFWNWFEKENQFIKDCLFNNVFQEVFQKEFSDRVDRVSKKFSYRMRYNPTEKNYELSFSAYGVRKLFPRVTKFVEYAPTLPEWNFGAIHQPITDLQPFIDGTDMPFEIEDFSFKISDLYFSIIDFDTVTKELSICVYFPNTIDLMFSDGIFSLTEIILYEMLGEYYYFKTIKSLEIVPQPYDTQNLIPLYKILENVKFLININRRKKIDIS